MKKSCGLLMYKFDPELKLFLVHPGGPFWNGKDRGVWSIPKGEPRENEDFLEAAKREFKEETGIEVPSEKDNYLELGKIKQKSGKTVYAWAFEGDWEGILMCSSYVSLEWPQKSKRKISFPEVDKAGFFSVEQTKEKINVAQLELVSRLIEKLEKRKTLNISVA